MLFGTGTKVRVRAGAVAIVYTRVDTHDIGYYPDSQIHVEAFVIPEDFVGVVKVVNHRKDLRSPSDTTIVVNLKSGEEHVFVDKALAQHVEEVPDEPSV